MTRPVAMRWCVGLACLALGSSVARGQAVAAPPGSAPRGTAAALAAQASNPYLNPALNPNLLQQPGGRDLMWLSFLSANDVNGGLGSGRISGSRGDSALRARSGFPPELTRPAAGASRYFNRGPTRPAPRPTGVRRQARHDR